MVEASRAQAFSNPLDPKLRQSFFGTLAIGHKRPGWTGGPLLNRPGAHWHGSRLLDDSDIRGSNYDGHQRRAAEVTTGPPFAPVAC